MPREVPGRDFDVLASLSEPDDLEAFSNGSLSEALRADLDRWRPGFSGFSDFSLVGDSASSLDFLEFDLGGGAAPQKPQDEDCWSRTTFGRSFLDGFESSLAGFSPAVALAA